MRLPSKPINKRLIDAESNFYLPPGFRFHPTDEELILHYLGPKSQSPTSTIIADVDLYKHDPWELPDMAMFGTKEWYFFTPRGRKHPNGSRPNRVTGNGYWKATGSDKPIKSKSDPNTTIGVKKALVFYSGKGVKGIKTNWIMHEYRIKPINATISTVDDWVLCRLYNKKNDRNEMVVSEDALQKQNSCSNMNDGSDSYGHSNGEFGGVCEGDAAVTVDLQADSWSEVKGSSEEVSVELMDSVMKMEDDGNDWLDSEFGRFAALFGSNAS